MSRSQKIRLVLIVGQFPKLSETFLIRKFLGLIEAGWDVHVLRHTRGDDDQYFDTLREHDEARHRVHDVWPHRPRFMASLCLPFALLTSFTRNRPGTIRYLKSCRTEGLTLFQTLRDFYLDSRLIELAPCLVHFEFGSFAAGRMHLKHRLGCATAVSFRGFDLNFALRDDRRFLDEIFDNADGLHVLGESLFETARQLGCPEHARVALIPPAVDIDQFSPIGTGSDSRETLRIVSVGRLNWKKGYEYALQAIRHLLDQGVACHYRIIGQGEYLTALAFTRFELGLEEHVTFCGALSPDRIREELRNADVLMHAAVTEGFCNAVVEAQATGLPVVCSDAGGLVENIEDGVTGYLVPRRDPVALASKLAQLASDPALRQRLGGAGRQRALERFSIHDQIAAFDDFYKSTLEIAQ